MNASVRAALVGAVVGLTQFIIVCWRDPGIGVLDVLMLMFVPYALGSFLTWWGQLPRWWAVAMAGPCVTVAFSLLNFPLMALPENTHLGDLPTMLMFMALGASSYLAAGGLVMPLHRNLRVLTAGGVALAYLAVWSAQDVLIATTRAHRLERAGVPLIAPVLPDYRLMAVSDSQSWLQLWYVNDKAGSAVDVAVGPPTTTARAACRKALPWRDNRSGNCRRVSPDVWRSTAGSPTSVYGAVPNALIRVESDSLSEADLVALLQTFRSVKPLDLRPAS